MAIHKNVILVFLFSLAVFLSSACQISRPPSFDAIRIRQQSEPITLNPILSSDTSSYEIENYFNDNLVEIDLDTLEYKPELATHWEVSEDKKTYTFYLRKDVKWHDGHPFDADDIVFSFKKVYDENTNAPHTKALYSDIESVEKVDDHTVRFRFKKIYFRSFLVCSTISILPKHVLENVKDMSTTEYSRAPIGTGPYRFKEWVSGRWIRLERNENYWGKKPEIKTLDFKFVHDASIALQVLKKGLIDIAELRNIQWFRQTSSKKFQREFKKMILPDYSYSYIGWNQKNPIFSDKRVRHAMTHLIDRQKLLEKLMFGLGQVVIGPFVPHGSNYNRSIKPLAYDLDRAKQLLLASGWIDRDGDGVLDKNGQKFSFVFLVPSGSKFVDRMATIMKEDFSKVGIDVQISKVEWAVYLDRLNKKNFDAVSLVWSTPLQNDPYQVWHSSQSEKEGGFNFISFINKESDRLIERAQVEYDPEKRRELYFRFQEILHEEQPYTFLFNNPKLLAARKRFSNMTVHRLGIDILEWKVQESK